MFKKEKRKKREKIFAIIIFICVLAAFIYCGRNIYQEFLKGKISFKDIFGITQDDMIEQEIDSSLSTTQRENARYNAVMKEIDENYKLGKAAVNSENMQEIERMEVEPDDLDIMCQDLYDADGNIIWKGISVEEAENPTEELQTEFEKAYKLWEMRSAEANEDVELVIDENLDFEGRLLNLCIDYNESIPYSPDGYSYCLGYFDRTETSDVITGDGGGLCGLGYLTWVFRNCLGYTPDYLAKNSLHEDKLTPIAVKELQTGDICVYESKHGNKYGVVVGKAEGHPVVSVCDNVADSEQFVNGCNHMCYIKSDYDELMGKHLPIDFNKFYRI